MKAIVIQGGQATVQSVEIDGLKLLKARGELSLEDAAAAIGDITPQYLNQLELGKKKNISPEKLERISHGLNKPITYFLKNAEKFLPAL